MGLTRARIEDIRSKLKAMPPPPSDTVDTTKQEAVRLLAREIGALQKRGYSLEQIAEALRGEGLVLLTPTLKSYLARAKAHAKRRPAGARTNVAAGAVAPATTGVAPAGKAAVMRATATRMAGKGTPGVTPPITDAVTGAEPAIRSGKDAFLIKDKDSY